MDSKNNETRIPDEALEQVAGGSDFAADLWKTFNPLKIAEYAMDILTGEKPYCPVCGEDLKIKLYPFNYDEIFAHIRGCADAMTHKHDKKIGG